MTYKQLSFDLPTRPAMNREAFFVAPSNAEAVSLIDDSGCWPGGRLLLLGPAGSGKTHLAHVWAALTDARIVSAETLTKADVPTLSAGPLVIEDAHKLAGHREQQETLFHI